VDDDRVKEHLAAVQTCSQCRRLRQNRRVAVPLNHVASLWPCAVPSGDCEPRSPVHLTHADTMGIKVTAELSTDCPSHIIACYGPRMYY